MTMLQSAIERLVAQSRSVRSPAELRPFALDVLDLRAHVSPAELTQGVQALSEALDPRRATHCGWLAITAGALLEAGADSRALEERLIECLPDLAHRAVGFGEQMLAHSLSLEASGEIDDDTGGEWVMQRFVPPAQLGALLAQYPDGADAWDAIPFWFQSAIACFSRDAALRKRASLALPKLARLAELTDNAKWLQVLFSVLDDEPFLVLHPATGQGFRLRISGVADNFQLHTLLADMLIDTPSEIVGLSLAGLPGFRPDPSVVAVARGDGSSASDVPSSGAWDLYNWTALRADGRLPDDVPTDHWIWGEGIPADIVPFDGLRVVLLAPPSYLRNWNSVRQFSALRASIVVEEVLAAASVKDWLARLGAASGSQG